MTKYVLSTATCHQRFVEYAPSTNGGVNTSVRSILIRGGANSPSLKSGFGDMTETEMGAPLWTPQGMVTPVSDEDAAFLEAHVGFQAAVERGFYKILDANPGDSHSEVKKIVEADMTKRDSSAPLTTETLKSQVKVTTKLVEEE